MKDIVISVLLATYSVVLPLLFGYVIRVLSNIRDNKIAGHERLVESVSQFTMRLDDVEQAVKELSYKIKLDEAMTSRYRIIRAADELVNGMELSAEHLEQLGEDIEIYRSFCAQHKNYKNHKGQNSMKLVEDYEKKLRVEQIKAI